MIKIIKKVLKSIIKGIGDLCKTVLDIIWQIGV